jgi:hypothetical protein
VTKPCSKCKGNKPLDQFRKDDRYKSGLSSNCRDCMKAASKARRLKEKRWKEENGIPTEKGIDILWNGEKIRVAAHKVHAGPNGVYTKRCCACKKWNFVGEFRKRGKSLHSDCIKCEKKYRAQWREDNREHLRQYRKDRRQKQRAEKENLINKIAELEDRLEELT